MNEIQLKELLTAEMNDSAPDKDALWAKIEGRLQPKEVREVPKKKPINLHVIRAMAAAAACVALIAIVPAVLNRGGMNSEQMTSSADGSMSMVQDEAAAGADEPAYEDNAVQGGQSSDTVIVKPTEFLNYRELEFSSYSETIYSCIGTPYGEAYFVEEDVLAQTERIVRAEVTAVFQQDESSICYELAVSESYPESDENVIIVESCSPYKMRRGREYLLPLAKTEDGWRTVHDSLPQIEFDIYGGAVYYNGWSSLDTGGSQSLIYPQESEEAYFYDRMMYSQSGDITALIGKWESLERS